MITYVEGSLFASPAQTLVNTVNSVGVMGKGLAKAFKSYFPEMFEDYKRLCESGDITAGRLLLYRTAHKWVLNFPTKRHWRQLSRLADIEAGLQAFSRAYAEQGIVSAAFPQLGCGNGGLDWESQVRPLMERYLGQLPIEIYVFLPGDTASDFGEVDDAKLRRWLLGNPSSRSFDAFWQDLVTAVSTGTAAHWTTSGRTDALLLSNTSARLTLARDDLLEIWRHLRTLGYLVPADVSDLLAIPPASIFALLNALPYVAPAKAARISSSFAYDVRSTQAMLDAPEAQGVQLILPLLVEWPEPLLSRAPEDTSWNESQTISQLELSLTS
jgi:O-acetyl-ADP-ribose deacetylase (regulator of RNase III)